jgi:hypothetical protein
MAVDEDIKPDVPCPGILVQCSIERAAPERRPRMSTWTIWKKMYGAWEGATTQVLEPWLKSPALLEPTGAALSSLMRAKVMGDRMTAAWWSMLGLPTKRDQERTLHALNQLHSRVLDLEERLVAAGTDAP